MKRFLTVLFSVLLTFSTKGAGLVNGTLSPVNNGTNSGGGSSSNAIQQLNGFGTNTTLVNPTVSGTLNVSGTANVTALNAGNLIVSNGILGHTYAISLQKTNQSSSLASTPLWTNSSGGYQMFMINGGATVITNNTTGTLTIAFAWTNELGAQTYTPMNAVSTASTSTDPFASEYIVVSNGTQVSVSTTQANVSGTAHWNLFTDLTAH